MNDANIHAVYFADENNGFCVGSPLCAFKTTNRGTNWNAMTISNCSWLNDVFLINQDIGWTVCDGIFQTLDGGISWEKVNSSQISAVYFVNTQEGWAVGANGTILHQNSELNSIRQYDNVSRFNLNYSLESDIIYFEYLIQKPNNVEISIYNINGVKVNELQTECSNTGVVTIPLSLNNLNWGIYLCKIKIGDFIQTQRIIK